MIQLSIIVPVYNKVRYLDACIESILAQTFSEFELILVDDGSTDESDLVCLKYAVLDQRIRIISQINSGVSSARNTGIQAAKGQFIGFVDGDDTIQVDMYKLLMDNIVAFHADVSVCRLRTISEDKIGSPTESAGPLLLNHQEALSANIKGELDRSANNKVYKTEFARMIEFEGSIYEDILFTNRMFMRTQQTVVENIVKYNYMIRHNSASMQIFHPGYEQTIQTSARILDMVSLKEPDCVEEAKAFDIETNLSLLNLILLSGRSGMPQLYQKVVSTLWGYRNLISTNHYVRRKHKYAIQLFYTSPWLYRTFLYLYCTINKSDSVKRTST
jgi:glycosyltransferase involved in cell wall biosynthesis